MSLINKFIEFRNRNYSVPLRVDLFIGVPGAGKSTLAAKFAKRDLSHNCSVWSNVDIKGCYKIDPKTDIGVYDISNGRLILDEIGICFNNRNWKSNLSDSQMNWLKKHRHYRVHIDCFSQGLDFDNRFLSLASNVYIVRRSLIPFHVVYTRIIKRVGVNKDTHELVDGYFKSLFGSRWIFAPTVWKMFNSYDTIPLPTKHWQIY